jgi:tRNA U38,U39,U40 pseudouridine synthase TruA
MRAPKPQENKEGKEGQKKPEQSCEMDYCKMINGCLPPEIRAMSCVSVPDEFNAR